MDLTKGKILVSGAGGFIGSHLTEALVAKGCDVRALVHYRGDGRAGWLDHVPAETRKAIEVVQGDVRDPGLMLELVEGCRTVFHLAALISIPWSYRAPHSFLETNAGGTLNLLQAARHHGVERFVQTSTSEVYGSAQYVPMDEAHPLNAQSPYAASKIAADQMALSFHRSYGLPVCVVRPFNTYGPRQSARAVIPSLILQMLKGGIVHVGNTAPIRDFVFVRETGAGFIALAESDNCIGGVFNLATGTETSVGKAARQCAIWVGRSGGVELSLGRFRPSASEVMRLCGNGEKARRLAGWYPRHLGLVDLPETVEWFRANAHLYPEGHQV